MSKFTRDEPFEFEYEKGRTVRIWLNEGGRVVSTLDGWPTRELTAALHAFIKAERDEWAWTSDDHTEARKGRWVAREHAEHDGHFVMGHDDFPGVGMAGTFDQDFGNVGRSTVGQKATRILQDFLTWKSAQDQPSEPAGLGAVVRVEPSGARFVRDFGGTWDGNFHVTGWADICNLGPVTILSEGVQR